MQLDETTPSPSVSIIIPASRPLKLRQALEAIKQQHYTGSSEIIVVGPPGPLLEEEFGLTVVHPEAVREPGRARNIGALRARGEILLFLDDDMIVSEDWIKRNVCELQSNKVGIVGARMPGKSARFFARCVDFTNCGHYQHRQAMNMALGSGSMGIASSLFQQVGGFDEALCSSEDLDLCYRIQRSGYQTRYQPEIVVIHDHQHTTLSGLLHYNYRHGLAGGLTTRTRYQSQELKNRLLVRVQYPPLFLLLLPWIALVATVQIVLVNVREQPHVLLYAPFIWLGKLAYQFGIFIKLLQK